MTTYLTHTSSFLVLYPSQQVEQLIAFLSDNNNTVLQLFCVFTTMETVEMECDIMNRLFDLDLDELIQKIFLSLDPLSLKSCKCVSSECFTLSRTDFGTASQLENNCITD